MNEPCSPLGRGLLIPCRGDTVFGFQEEPVPFKIMRIALVLGFLPILLLEIIYTVAGTGPAL